ncbi:MAG: BatA domain-containing protein [Gemmatimonadaceae bacterium]
MTFLAPWALAIGALGAVGMVLLHLVALQRPAAYVLPTTRFIPDQRTLVSRAATRPRDLLLLALRVLVLLAAAAAFARPVVTPSRGAVARVVLLDRSRAVADPADAARRAQALVRDGAPFALVTFDSSATVQPAPAWDTLSAATHSTATGSLSAALVAGRRAAVSLAQRADSVELVVVSPVMSGEIDGATAQLRALWPGVIHLERVAARTDTATSWQLERAIPLDDPLGPAMSPSRAQRGRAMTRLVRGAPSPADSAFARAGGTVVRWDTTSARSDAEGLALGDDVIVASVVRMALPVGVRTRARWADGTPAAIETPFGAGCMRQVGVGIPQAGDLPLRPGFQRIVRGFLQPCGVVAATQVADSATIRALVGTTTAKASADVLRAGSELSSPLARWLLALALLLALLELVARVKLPAEAT